VKTVSTLEGRLLADGEKKVNGTKLIFSITTNVPSVSRSMLR